MTSTTQAIVETHLVTQNVVSYPIRVLSVLFLIVVGVPYIWYVFRRTPEKLPSDYKYDLWSDYEKHEVSEEPERLGGLRSIGYYDFNISHPDYRAHKKRLEEKRKKAKREEETSDTNN